jgi:ABC-type multidrug transport system permease subunit
MVIWTLAKKEMRVLVRDRMAAIMLLGLPIVFILVLGLLLGEGFGSKPDDRIRVYYVDLDDGPCGLSGEESWSKVVMRDLAETSGIKPLKITTLDEAKQLIAFRKVAAVLVFNKDFSANATRCSFLSDGINPFHRDGVYLERVGVQMLSDTKQPAQAAVVEQVAQVSLLRVLLPWMIGRAFEKLSEDKFIDLLGTKVNLPVPEYVPLGPLISRVKEITVATPFGDFKTTPAKLLSAADVRLDPKGNPRTQDLIKAGQVQLDLDEKGHANLNALIALAARGDPEKERTYRGKIGEGVQAALSQQFKNYDLTGKTWASLTKSKDAARQEGAAPSEYQSQDGSGFLKRGAQRYQVLVPSYTVMFAFFLVLNVGWVFVTERRQGTLKRLRAAPISRGQILLGKLVPYFLLSLGQGAFLMIAGRLLFGLRWGPDSWPLWQQVACLVPVIFTTSVASMGLALLVAAVARSEIQVALYGAVPVLILALIGGCVLPREMMPEQAQSFALLTPQGWALDAYRELLDVDANSQPNLTIVFRACGVLAGFGAVFIGMAWGLLRLE